MNEKNFQQQNAFEKLLTEKEEANMRYISECIHEEYYSTAVEDIEIPADIDENLIAFCREKDKEEKNRKHRQKNVYIAMRRCAIALICFGLIGGFSISSVDAWKLRFLDLFVIEEDDHISIKPTDIEEFEKWDNYYCLSLIPDGYEVSYCEERGTNRQIYYSNNSGLIAVFQYDAGASANIDNETVQYEKLTVRNLDAYYFEDHVNLSRTLVWLEGEYLLRVYCEGDESIKKDDILSMAENILFVK